MTHRYDMTCDQGATFIREIFLSDDEGVPAADYTGWSLEMQVRRTHSDKVVIAAFTEANGRVVVDGPLALFTVKLTDEETSLLVPRQYVYDALLVAPTGDKDRLLEGNFIVTAGVTRVPDAS
jgi:hypothetical protein